MLWPCDRTHVGWFIQHYPAFIGGDFNWMWRATCNLGMDKVYLAQRLFASKRSFWLRAHSNWLPSSGKKEKGKKKKAWEIGALWRLCLSHNLQNSAANWHFLKQPRRLVVEVLRPFDPATAADLSSSSAASISRERGSDRPASSRREYLLTPQVANFNTTVLALWHLDEKNRLIALKTRRGIQLEPPHR